MSNKPHYDTCCCKHAFSPSYQSRDGKKKVATIQIKKFEGVLYCPFTQFLPRSHRFTSTIQTSTQVMHSANSHSTNSVNCKSLNLKHKT
jgi:hypothetical protein